MTHLIEAIRCLYAGNGIIARHKNLPMLINCFNCPTPEMLKEKRPSFICITSNAYAHYAREFPRTFASAYNSDWPDLDEEVGVNKFLSNSFPDLFDPTFSRKDIEQGYLGKFLDTVVVTDHFRKRKVFKYNYLLRNKFKENLE